MDSDDVSLAHAAETFRTTTAGAAARFDPAAIKSEIAALKESCSKLKFQYLEQESRDKFLRLLLLRDVDSVAQRDVDALLEKNSTSKAEVRVLKNELEQWLEQSETVAEDVIATNKRLEEREAAMNAALAEVTDLQQQMDELARAPENEGYMKLLELNRMIDSQDVGPDEAIRIAEADLLKDQDTLGDLIFEESALLAEDNKGSELVAELQRRLQTLSAELASVSRAPAQSDPEQMRAQRLRELNTSLQKITIEPVEVRQNGDNYVLSCGENEVVFSHDLQIVSAPNRLLSPASVARVNRMSGEERRKSLGALLGKMW